MNIKSADVIIVGAGIAGNSTAYYARKRGLSCIVLEEEMIGHGGSSRNGGGARQSGRDEREMPLAIFATRRIWPYLNEELGVDVEYRQRGYLLCGYDETDAAFLLERVKVAKRFGIDMYIKREDEIWDNFPYISRDVKVASWTPSDAVVNPLRATLAFYKRGREMGVQYITGEKVIKINKIRGRARQVVTANGNIYEGDTIVIAAGYNSRMLLNTVGIDVPLFKRLLNTIVTEPMERLFDHMIGGTRGLFGGYYGQQTVHGSFVFGGNSGREHCYAEKNDPKTTNVTPPGICNSIGNDIPAVSKLKVIRAWGGWADMSVDGVPIVGTVDEVPGLLVTCGASGHGFCPGPAVGYSLAELAAGLPTTVDISKLHYDRFDYFKKQDRYLV